ncbi:hypothetical protein BGX27_003785 [Mortierella sp. AM989]|nr:hypothetical protein BGX27_003785 [Mortierella sp. AM989]
MVQLVNESSYQLQVKLTARSIPTGDGNWIPIGSSSMDEWKRLGVESMFIVCMHGWYGLSLNHNGFVRVKDDGIHFIQDWNSRGAKSGRPDPHVWFQNQITMKDIQGWDMTPIQVLELFTKVGCEVIKAFT